MIIQKTFSYNFKDDIDELNYFVNDTNFYAFNAN